MNNNYLSDINDRVELIGILQEVKDWAHSLPLDPEDMPYILAQNYVRSLTLKDKKDEKNFRDRLRMILEEKIQDTKEIDAKIRELDSIRLDVEYVVKNRRDIQEQHLCSGLQEAREVWGQELSQMCDILPDKTLEIYKQNNIWFLSIPSENEDLMRFHEEHCRINRCPYCGEVLNINKADNGETPGESMTRDGKETDSNEEVTSDKCIEEIREILKLIPSSVLDNFPVLSDLARK